MKTGLNCLLFIITACTLLISCAKEYSSETPLPPTGNWRFSDGSGQYAGNIESVYVTSGGSFNRIILSGKSNNGKENFQLILYADSIRTGTYDASESSFLYGSSLQPRYRGGGPYGEFVVNLTELDSVNIAGNFSGIVRDSANNPIKISSGIFEVH